MKIKKIVIFIVCLLFTNSCNTALLCIPSAKKVKVEDVFLRKNYIPSYKINTNDKYCVFRQDWDYGLNTKKYNALIFDKQIIQILRDFGINFKKEDFVPSLKNKEVELFLQKISEREIKNNYENCSYIIYYDIVTHGDRLCVSTFGINIRVFNIKENKEITQYSLDKATYQLSQQEEFTKELMNKWWKFQNKPNKKKFEAMECNYIGCKTIKCKGDNCTISEIKEYK